jgi:hypothetical protein
MQECKSITPQVAGIIVHSMGGWDTHSALGLQTQQLHVGFKDWKTKQLNPYSCSYEKSHNTESFLFKPRLPSCMLGWNM